MRGERAGVVVHHHIERGRIETLGHGDGDRHQGGVERARRRLQRHAGAGIDGRALAEELRLQRAPALEPLCLVVGRRGRRRDQRGGAEQGQRQNRCLHLPHSHSSSL
jgi:hypothetical protein